MDEDESLSHSTRQCKYRVIFLIQEHRVGHSRGRHLHRLLKVSLRGCRHPWILTGGHVTDHSNRDRIEARRGYSIYGSQTFCSSLLIRQGSHLYMASRIELSPGPYRFVALKNERVLGCDETFPSGYSMYLSAWGRNGASKPLSSRNSTPRCNLEPPDREAKFVGTACSIQIIFQAESCR